MKLIIGLLFGFIVGWIIHLYLPSKYTETVDKTLQSWRTKLESAVPDVKQLKEKLPNFRFKHTPKSP